MWDFIAAAVHRVARKGFCCECSHISARKFKDTLFNDPTRDSIANNFVIGVYCKYLQILYQIIFFYKI